VKVCLAWSPFVTRLLLAYAILLAENRRKYLHLITEELDIHQQNVKTSPGPPSGVMVPLVLLVHPDPPWSTFSVKFQKVWIRMDRCGPGGPRGPQPPLVDHERSGPSWTTL